jgi:hypothetical protein
MAFITSESINDVHPLMASILMKIRQIAYARRIST